MSSITLVLIGIVVLFFVGAGVLVRIFIFPTKVKSSSLSNLTGMTSGNNYSATNTNTNSHVKITLEEVQAKMNNGGKTRAVNPNDPEVLFFRAGYFSNEQRAKFYRLKRTLQIVLPLGLGALLFVINGPIYLLLGAAGGYMVARVMPDHILSKKAKVREEESLYFLPLVIEQISIGVSSSLDVGPCVAYVVSMADERGTHNVVTELLTQVTKLMKAGMALDEALMDVGEVVGIKEVKNSFMFLAQCAKHGGEISKQLQELAESVTTARQLEIEAKIIALPNKATGALGMVFFGFFIMLVSGIFVRVIAGMGG